MRSSNRWALAAGFAVVLIAAVVPSILAQGKGGTAAPAAAYVPDHAFLVNAATAGLEQVRLARLAVLKAVNPDVKSFAQKLVDERGKANDQLRQLASSKGVKELPSHPDQSTQVVFDSLSKRVGENFDFAYMQRVVEDSQSDVGMFANEAQNGTDADIRQLAANVLPSLREYLRTAQGLSNKIEQHPSRGLAH
jgi:putative membrane protein